MPVLQGVTDIYRKCVPYAIYISTNTERYTHGINNILKLLTIIVPAYNSSKTLKSTLDSFLDLSLLDKIEVLIVNDGSADDTAAIAQQYADKYPSFRLINKENGGHGSVINYASKAAEGKYFKVVDSDDKLLTQNLRFYIENLKKSNADVILTFFRTLDCRSGYTREYRMSGIDFGREYTFEEFWKHGKNGKTVFPVFQLH